MSSILIRRIPEELLRRLKERAAAKRRSLSREVLLILEEAVAKPTSPGPLKDIDRLRVTGSRLLNQGLLDRARASSRP